MVLQIFLYTLKVDVLILANSAIYNIRTKTQVCICRVIGNSYSLRLYNWNHKVFRGINKIV